MHTKLGYQYGRIPWGDADITCLVDENGLCKFCLQELCSKVCVCVGVWVCVCVCVGVCVCVLDGNPHCSLSLDLTDNFLPNSRCSTLMLNQMCLTS